MKSYLNVLFLLAMTAACKDSDKVKPENPAPCSSSDYVQTEEFKSAEMFVVSSSIFATTETIKFYFLSTTEIPADTGYWIPCNLPKQFQKDKLAVRISGHKMLYVGKGSILAPGPPVEITRIETR